MNSATLNFRELPLSERIQLVEDIWDSIAQETSSQLLLSSADHAELHGRLAEHHAKPDTSIPWAQVRTDLFKNQS